MINTIKSMWGRKTEEDKAKPFLLHGKPTVVKPARKIEVKQLGLTTGKYVRVRLGSKHRKINIYYKETK